LNFTDQIGHQIKLKKTPKRIISVVPSQTELLYDLGSETEVIGITKFCIHPKEWFKIKTIIGGTKNLSIEKIKALKPDLIIANKEENTKEQIEELQQLFPVWTSNIKNLNEAKDMIFDVGEIVDKKDQANRIINEINNEFLSLKMLQRNSLKVVYLIWNNPFMTVSKNTFISDMLTKSGFLNLINTNKPLYPEISVEEINTLNPDLIFLSSEPFPFKEKHKKELLDKGVKAKIIFVDGEMFSWYGSRLQLAPKYFVDLVIKIKND